MRGKAEPLENPGLSVPGSVQCNILLTLATESGLSRSWAHVHAHRMGGNLHKTHKPPALSAGQHTQSCVFGLGFDPSVKEPTLQSEFSHLLIPW